jgi:hypothetical protein
MTMAMVALIQQYQNHRFKYDQAPETIIEIPILFLRLAKDPASENDIRNSPRPIMMAANQVH